MKSKSASEWLKAFGGIFQELTSRGVKPKLQTMDNEASSALKSYFTENDMTYHFFNPPSHRRNSVERSIRTSKEHFLAGLSSVDPELPMYLWDCTQRCLLQHIFTVLLITTKPHLLRQDAR
jgi:hypothetical protein